MEKYRKKAWSGLASLLVLLPGLASQHNVYSAEWRIEVVDPGDGGSYTSLLMDQTGNGHAAYINDQAHQLKYAFWDHHLTKWFAMKVDNSAGGFASIALDSTQRPHISYLEYNTGRLKHAYWNGSSWKIEPVLLSARLLEYYTSITIDRDDHPVITYYEVLDAGDPDYSLHLRSAKFNGQFWEISTVDGTKGSGKFNSVVTAADGRIHIAYANVRDENASLRYAYSRGNSWQYQILEGAGQVFYVHAVSITTDKQNNPHIVYTDVANRCIKYATRKDGDWKFQVVASMIREGYPDRNGIALDDHGDPYISFYDAGAGTLKLAHREGGRWISEVVDANFAGFTNSIQISNGEIIIVYLDSGSNSLKCARRPLAAGEALSQNKLRQR